MAAVSEVENKQSVLVTGASRGIGKAVAIRLGAQGYHVIVHYGCAKEYAQGTLAEIKEHGGTGRLLSFNVSNRTECREQLEQDIVQYGCYYGVVCNAGISRDNAFPSMTGDDWDDVIRTNLDGFYNVLQPLIMPMVHRRQAGRIITLASVSGLIGNRGQVNYSAAKAGIIGATKALALELAKRNITVNCVAPGLIDTDMIRDAPVSDILPMIPARRLGKPEEVASLVCYLMSEESSYITRQVISVNGGLA